MDRMRPVHVRQRSNISASSAGASSPPSMSSSPMMNLRHARSGSVGGINMKKPQNTKAAAQRLAQVMAHQQSGDDSDEEDDLDLLVDYKPASVTSSSSARTSARPIRPASPMSVRTSAEQPLSARSMVTGGRPSQAPVNNVEPVQPPSARSPFAGRSSHFSNTTSTNVEQVQPPSFPRSPFAPRSSQGNANTGSTGEQIQPPSARSQFMGRSSQFSNISTTMEQPLSARAVNAGHLRSSQAAASAANSLEQPPSARSGRPNIVGIKTVPMVPASVPLSLRPTASSAQGEAQPEVRKDKRLSMDMGTFNFRESGNQHSASALQDELDMLQEENESLLEKLRLAEEKCEEAEVRARQLEKQVASLGEGVTLEARLLNRKEASLQQREAALKAAAQTYGVKGGEVANLRMEAESARDEATLALDQLHEVEGEVRSLRIMTKRMILTQEEMEEVVLKRCWLSRYWNLCVEHGIHAEIAGMRYEYWSSYAPLPFEVVIAAGQKAKDESTPENNDAQEREEASNHLNEMSGEGNVESMLLVEQSLRELTSLKVEDALALAMAQKRRPSALKCGLTDELKLPIEGQQTHEAYELTKEESEDVVFKQAWLTYFWKRAKNHGLEPDIVEDRWQFWMNHDSRAPTSHDAVDVERGLVELRKLGIETQLWQESRKLIDPYSDHSKMHVGSNF